MKSVKRIFYGICILIMLLCAGVFICAFNPSMTDSLAALVQKLPENPDENQTGGQTDGAQSGQSGNQTDGQNGGTQTSGDQTEESSGQPESSEDTYPTLDEPLEWESDKKEEGEEEGYTGKTLEDEGISRDSVLQDMDAYYKDCYNQLIEAEGESIQFTNVIPKALWDSIESVYTDGSYKKGYSDKVLKEKEEDIFTIQIQAERLPENHYRIHHNVYIASEE